MPGYRVYFLNTDGKIERREDFYADDDATALRLAKAMAKGKAAELWDEGKQMIADIPAE